MNTTTKTRTSKGRQKIEIKKIEKMSSRLVSRSKRFKSVFNKAAELCVLTGAEIAVIVKYPGGRTTHAFGHPSVDTVTERFLYGGGGNSLDLGMSEDFIKGYQERYEQLEKELEAEKKLSEMIAKSNVENNGEFWWNQPIDGLGIENLEAYVEALEELKKKVNTRAEEMWMEELITVSSMLE